MDQTTSGEEMWLEWMSTYKTAIDLQIEGSLAEAINVINLYLDTKPPLDLQGEALGCRAMLYEDQGNLENSMRDLIGARSLSSPGGFSRYTLELSLGDLCERLRHTTEARNWYREALSTVADDPLTSGGAAIRRLVKLIGPDKLTLDERQICERVAKQSWQLLGLDGEPDLSHLSHSAQLLLEAEAKL